MTFKLQKTSIVFQLKGENRLPISGLFFALLRGFFLDVILEKHWTEGKKCIIEMFFSWEACELLITLNFLDAVKWEIGSGKQKFRPDCQKGESELKFLSSPVPFTGRPLQNIKMRCHYCE